MHVYLINNSLQYISNIFLWKFDNKILCNKCNKLINYFRKKDTNYCRYRICLNILYTPLLGIHNHFVSITNRHCSFPSPIYL